MPEAMPPRADEAAAVDHAGAADPHLRGDLGQAIDRHLAHVGRFEPVRLLAVGRRLAVEQAHAGVDPRAGAHAGQQRLLRQRADEVVQPAVVDLLPQPEAARDQERVHVGCVVEAVVGQHGESGLRLHRPQRLRRPGRHRARDRTGARPRTRHAARRNRRSRRPCRRRCRAGSRPSSDRIGAPCAVAPCRPRSLFLVAVFRHVAAMRRNTCTAGTCPTS